LYLSTSNSLESGLLQPYRSSSSGLSIDQRLRGDIHHALQFFCPSHLSKPAVLFFHPLVLNSPAHSQFCSLPNPCPPFPVFLSQLHPKTSWTEGSSPPHRWPACRIPSPDRPDRPPCH